MARLLVHVSWRGAWRYLEWGVDLEFALFTWGENMQSEGRLLIIDDDKVIFCVFCEFFESKGFCVVPAWDASQAIRLVEVHSPQVIITDILMPDMDGLEFILRIKKQYPEESRPPIIAISGGIRHLEHDHLKEAALFGAARTFRKPVSLSDLYGAVKDLVL